eukprot:TRINITY_DN5683_c0_g1_i16.p1 TRINITY_DN5683_c0_g1~~TRINITY_DN5683_c0_g1_i16.p1  ORF type:complete len:346 (-),score=43.85 TRINITY_DN5683_c0_g1_i16:35-1072(-)
MVVQGPRHYFHGNGWLNLMDWLALLAFYFLWVYSNIYIGVLPELHIPSNIRTDNAWTLALVQSDAQTILGMACFAMIVKGLKYTWNIPIMCNIGNTFSHAFVPVGLLLVVVFFLLFGFAVVFQIKFAASQMVSFNSLGRSLFSVFRGLLGDMDTDGIFAAAPSFGPILFCLYVTVVLFVAFTILIALICDSFSAVRHQDPGQGLVVSLVAWYKGKDQRAEGPEGDGPKRELDVEPKIELEPNPALCGTGQDAQPTSWQHSAHGGLQELAAAQGVIREELRELACAQVQEHQAIRVELQKMVTTHQATQVEFQQLAGQQAQIAEQLERVERLLIGLGAQDVGQITV